MPDIQGLYKQYLKAKNRRDVWENTWRECYEYALPQRESTFLSTSSKTNQLFDGTAPDCVDQLSALMLSELTPPWMNWFQLTAGVDLSTQEAAQAGPTLNKITQIVQTNFDRSNLALEIHQCFLDLITVGTSCLLFEEAPIGSHSAFRFLAVPLSEVCLDEGPGGRLDCTFRRSVCDYNTLRSRFPTFELPDKVVKELLKNESKISLIESVVPRALGKYDYCAFLEPVNQPDCLKNTEMVLKESVFETSPFISFRWLKAPGEVYGRSPVMKALPDIKTVNKVVELVLKNATIATTGIWLAEDDGVLNPANIQLVPGAIIPKAVGSKGLIPLEAAGKFDVSQLITNDLHERIRHALLGDKLSQIESERMTATEVRERTGEMSRILGATYGRLQSELLMPLVNRAVSLLRKRGEIPEIFIDGRLLSVAYKSTRAEEQNKIDRENAFMWLNALSKLGDNALTQLDISTFIKWLSEKFNLPANLIKENNPVSISGIVAGSSL